MADFHGLAAHAAGAELLPFKYGPGELAPNDIEVRISHCGVCHSDIHLIDNDWGISRYPFIPGHEIVGKVTAVGPAVRDRQVGERVGIGWQADSCGICEWCRSGQEFLCPKAQPTCVGRHGGYANAIRVNSRFAVAIPEALESENAAPLLCAGVTVYTPLRNHLARPSSRVGIVGIGGLGHLAIQFARAFGCEVTALSTSRDKQDEARKLGAHAFVHTRETGALKRLAGAFDLILATASVQAELPAFLNALRPKGTFVILAGGSSPVSFPEGSLITYNKSIAGSSTGSPRDLSEMLDVAARHNIKAVTETFALKDANKAVARVKKNQVRYRAVLTVS